MSSARIASARKNRLLTSRFGGVLASVLLSTTLFSAALLSAGVASAQTDSERAGARSAAQQGAKAFADGKYAEAADLFARAESLVHAPPHLLYMARANDKLGKLVEARELYLKLSREQLEPKAPEAFRKAQADANMELQALEARVPYLTVSVKAPVPEGVQVLVDGQALAPALLGVESPINPGKHRLVAVVNGVEGSPNEVEVAEGMRTSAEVEPPASAPAAATATLTPAAASAEPVDTAPTDSKKTMRIGSYVAFGVGAVGLGLGTVFLIKGSGDQGDSDDLFNACNPDGCNESEREKVDSLSEDAAGAKTVSAIGFAGGLVGVGAGITLFILSQDNASESPKAARITPFIGWKSAGVSGTF